MTDSFEPLTTVEQLLAAARRHGLDLVADTSALDTSGLDFLAVHAVASDGTRWIVRSPRRADVVAAAQTEARILGLVAPALPVAVPDWRVHAADVIAYPRLAGQPAITVVDFTPTWHVIDPAAPAPAFLASLAEALAALARIPIDAARTAGVPVRTNAEDRAELAAAVASTREALAPPAALVARWERWLADDARWPAHVALSHGDLHPGHLLLADDATLVGILDWTEAKVTDPAVDLAMIHMCFGRAALETVAEHLERRGVAAASLIEHAIERAAIFPVLGAAWALKTNNEVVLAQVRAQLAAQEA